MIKEDYNKIIEMSKKTEEFVKQIFIDNGYIVQDNYKRTIADFFVEKHRKRYVVEVRRNDASSSKIHIICSELNKLVKDEKVIPILVIVGRESDYFKEKTKQMYNIEVIGIANLLYLVSDNMKMKDKLLSLLNFSTESIEEEPINFDIDLKKYQKQVEYEYAEKLENIAAGKTNATRYEKICVEILKYLFNDSLSLWNVQQKSNDDLYRFDLICKIKSNVDIEFFDTIERFFLSKYIVFEFKNYTDQITQKEIYTTEKYLYKTALRTASIIITRKGVDDNGLKAIKGSLRENGKLILVLDDNDLKKMINLKRHNEDYFEILTNKLDEMLVELEK